MLDIPFNDRFSFYGKMVDRPRGEELQRLHRVEEVIFGLCECFAKSPRREFHHALNELMVEDVKVLPGMDTTFEVPALAHSITPWTPPEPAVPDSLEETGLEDTGDAASDSLSVPQEKE